MTKRRVDGSPEGRSAAAGSARTRAAHLATEWATCRHAGRIVLTSAALPDTPADADLRFHPRLYCAGVKAELSALVARVSTVRANRAVGIHRIWIRAGERRAIAKRRLSGCDEPVCIRL